MTEAITPTEFIEPGLDQVVNRDLGYEYLLRYGRSSGATLKRFLAVTPLELSRDYKVERGGIRFVADLYSSADDNIASIWVSKTTTHDIAQLTVQLIPGCVDYQNARAHMFSRIAQKYTSNVARMTKANTSQLPISMIDDMLALYVAEAKSRKLYQLLASRNISIQEYALLLALCHETKVATLKQALQVSGNTLDKTYKKLVEKTCTDLDYTIERPKKIDSTDINLLIKHAGTTGLLPDELYIPLLQRDGTMHLPDAANGRDTQSNLFTQSISTPITDQLPATAN